MNDSSDERGPDGAGSVDGGSSGGSVASDEATARAGEPGAGSSTEAADGEDVEELRRRVEEKYDFDDFGPGDMAEMTAEEWDVAFDDDSWITGEALLERVEAELKGRIASREVFAVLEYARVDGRRCLVAYSDTDYAVVYPDGTVEGRGTVVRDVKPTVALCSMEEYEVQEPPADWRLPAPEAVPESGSELGNWMLQLLGAVQVLVGIGALVTVVFVGIGDNLVLLAAGLFFLVIGVILFAMVANARLSERFRVREYRDRLRSVGTAAESRPSFLPIDDDAFEGDPDERDVATDRRD